MRNFCSALVRTTGKSWSALGWTFWVVTMIVPLIPFVGAVLYPVYWGARILLGLWWLCDLVDLDMITTFFGSVIVLLFVIFILPAGNVFFIVSWLVYMTSIRRKT